MNILFLTSPAPQKAAFSTSEKRPPIGLGYLMSVVREKGHSVFFSDEYLRKTTLLETDFLNIQRIDCVGIYANTVCYPETRKMLAQLQEKREKKQWSGKIIVGGPHTSVGLATIPEYVDHIVIGEGEITLPKILAGQIHERVVVGEKVADLDALPLPAWDKFIFLPYEWTISWHPGMPVYPFNTSRGCPFSCTFCSVKAVWGREYRVISAERIVADIQHMVKHYGAQGIYFREDNFTCDTKRVVEFCELILKKNLAIDWFCETRVSSILDVETLKLMAKAGCKAFYIGVESGSPRILHMLNKGISIENIEKAFAITKQVDIKTYASFIVGIPGETADDLRMTDALIKQIQPDFICKNVYVGLPGSEMYEYIKERKLYEHKDDSGILYPLGYKKRARKYYNRDPYYRVY